MTAAEKHIRHYNHLNGKVITKAQLVRVYNALKADLDKGKIDIHGPLGAECGTIRQRMETAIGKMNGKRVRINLNVVPVDNILRMQRLKKEAEQKQQASNKAVPDARKEKAPTSATPPLKGPQTSQTQVPSVATSARGLKKKISLADGRYKDFVKLYEDTQVMYYGMPGSGKTYDLLQFLKYLADKGYPVAYVAAEEYGRSTMDEKIQEIFKQPSLQNFKYKNFVIVKSLSDIKNLSETKVIVFDSVDKIKWSVDDWTDFCQAHPNMIKIAIKQTTKEGDFKGGQEWSHEMDTVVEVRNRKRIFHKNRLDPEFGKKRDKLLMDDRIRRRRENLHINGIVKQSTAAAEQKPLATFQPRIII